MNITSLANNAKRIMLVGIALIIILTYGRYPRLMPSSDAVIIAILDTDINIKGEIERSIWTNEAELEDGIDNDGNGYIDDVNGYNFINGTGMLKRQNSSRSLHATTCAKLILDWCNTASRGKTIPLIMPIVVIDNANNEGADQSQRLIEGIKYAEDNGACICNMSLSTSEYNEELYECMKHSDMLFVVAAGNGTARGCNLDKVGLYPATFKLDNQITVAATDKDGKLCKNSNFSKELVDVAAYGGVPINSVGIVYGTSFATARCTGIAAAIAGNAKSDNAYAIKQAFLSKTVENPNFQEKIRDGMEAVPNVWQDTYR